MPLLFEAGPDGLSFRVCAVGILGFGEGGGFGFGEFEDIAVAGEVGDAEVGKACLAGTEELSGAALLEVEFG